MQEDVYAFSKIKGNINVPNLSGTVYFYPFKDGVMIEMEVYGLPNNKNYLVFPTYIEENGKCLLDKNGKFNELTNYYNPTEEKYPYEAGNMPPLFSNNGYAYLKFYTTRFKVFDIVGKSVVINESVDNLNTQKNGMAKIGCGKIEKNSSL